MAKKQLVLILETNGEVSETQFLDFFRCFKGFTFPLMLREWNGKEYSKWNFISKEHKNG